MLARIALAALVGAICGMLAATSGVLWPPASSTQTLESARTLARVEAAWHLLRQHRGR